MRVKIDENLPARLISVLVDLGHDVDTVVGEGLKGANDDDLWPAIQKAERFLITKDLGFSDARRYPPGTHRGILVFRCRTTGARSSLRGWSLFFAVKQSKVGAVAWSS